MTTACAVLPGAADTLAVSTRLNEQDDGNQLFSRMKRCPSIVTAYSGLGIKGVVVGPPGWQLRSSGQRDFEASSGHREQSRLTLTKRAWFVSVFFVRTGTGQRLGGRKCHLVFMANFCP